MFNWINKVMSKSIWYLLAALIAALVAGPEIIISMELMVLVEFLGASTFVLMYVSGLKLFLSNLTNKLNKFESGSTFFIPSLNALKQMPVLAIHAIPERTANIGFICFTSLAISYLVFKVTLGL